MKLALTSLNTHGERMGSGSILATMHPKSSGGRVVRDTGMIALHNGSNFEGREVEK